VLGELAERLSANGGDHPKLRESKMLKLESSQMKDGDFDKLVNGRCSRAQFTRFSCSCRKKICEREFIVG
jgi:hypothetical protein